MFCKNAFKLVVQKELMDVSSHFHKTDMRICGFLISIEKILI